MAKNLAEGSHPGSIANISLSPPASKGAGSELQRTIGTDLKPTGEFKKIQVP
jgi:hypothetical protein